MVPFQHIFAVQTTSHIDRQAFPAEFVQNRQHPKGTSVSRAIMHEVVVSDVTPAGRTKLGVRRSVPAYIRSDNGAGNPTNCASQAQNPLTCTQKQPCPAWPISGSAGHGGIVMEKTSLHLLNKHHKFKRSGGCNLFLEGARVLIGAVMDEDQVGRR